MTEEGKNIGNSRKARGASIHKFFSFITGL